MKILTDVRMHSLLIVAVLLSVIPVSGAVLVLPSEGDGSTEEMQIGIIGLDTSHAPAFTEIINGSDDDVFRDFRVTAAFPKGSLVIETSYSRIPEYTEAVEAMGVEIVESIESLVEKVDAVLLLTNDGQRHLEQALPVLEAGLPLFIDKPIAASLKDAIRIFDAAEKYSTPVFSSSSLRYAKNVLEVRSGDLIGEVIGAQTYSPAHTEEHHPDLFWYGVHGVEMLFTVLGTGCETVLRVSADGTDIVVGRWEGDRMGTFRGIRKGAGGFGGAAFGSEGIAPLGPFQGYEPLLENILEFFITGSAPVDKDETLELFAFMEAADESKRLGGRPVSIESVLSRARANARMSRAVEN